MHSDQLDPIAVWGLKHMQDYELVAYPHQKMVEKEPTDNSKKYRKKDTLKICIHCKNDTYSRTQVCAVCEILTPNRHLRMVRSGELTQGHERLAKT